MKRAIVTLLILSVFSAFPLISSTTDAGAAQQIRSYFDGKWQKYVPRNKARPAYWLRVSGSNAWRSAGYIHTIVRGTVKDKGKWMCVAFDSGGGCLAKGYSPRVARMAYFHGDMLHK